MSLQATLKAVADSRFNCSECLKKGKGRTDGETYLKAIRDSQGCASPLPEYVHAIPVGESGGAIRFRRCIGNYFGQQWLGLLEAYRLYQKGVLPCPGAALEQPAKIMEIFGIFEREEAKRREEELKKRERQAKAAQGRVRRGRR